MKTIEQKRIRKFMRIAVELSQEGMRKNKGGPFGAGIVKNNRIVGRGFNRVTSGNDPTAHAEVVAIRDACKRLRTFQLDGCELFTSCEPCPMCLGAIYWARPKAVYYANTRKDAARIGFDDKFIYDEINKSITRRRYKLKKVNLKEAKGPFKEWQKKNNKTKY